MPKTTQKRIFSATKASQPGSIIQIPAVVTSSRLVDHCLQDFRRLKPVFDWLSA